MSLSVAQATPATGWDHSQLVTLILKARWKLSLGAKMASCQPVSFLFFRSDVCHRYALLLGNGWVF